MMSMAAVLEGRHDSPACFTLYLCYTQEKTRNGRMVSMITIDEMQALLDEIVSEFPEEFFKELNGGIILLPDTVQDELSAPEDPLYIMGEYHSGGGLGRYIAIYYGSFAAVFEGLEGGDLLEEVREELAVTIRHEFRHHLESLAGADDLEREDAAWLEAYLDGENSDDGETGA